MFPAEDDRQPQGPWRVSELLAAVERRLEGEWPDVWVAGEVADLRRPSSGHLYFTLQDGEGRLRAVMFRGYALYLTLPLRDGQEILARGTLTLYARRGDLQLAVRFLEPLGEGSLRLRLERLRERLAAEGLFDAARKRPLPPFPRRVGVVTSASGAALQDFLEIMRRRGPAVEIVVAPCRVQGEGAAAEIVAALGLLARRGEVELIVVTRGGGSLEDLQPFNEEAVARAVAASPVPVISAVGHETDVTLCDFAADLRVPTPSAAAEAVTARQEDLARRLESLGRRLRLAERALLGAAGARLGRQAPPAVARGLRLRILQRGQRLDDLRGGLERAARREAQRRRLRLAELERRLQRQAPWRRLERRRLALQRLQQGLPAAMARRLEHRQARTRALAERLGALGPLAVLARGYSICRRRDAGRALVREAGSLRPGEGVDVILHRGELGCRVEEVRAGGGPAGGEKEK